jgi:phosphate transport system substrate-binding protein
MKGPCAIFAALFAFEIGAASAAEEWGIEHEFENIAGGQYPISRSMFFYVKGEHLGVMPGIAEYVKEFTSERAWSSDGYLVDKGLIPLRDAARAKVRKTALSFAPLSM